MRTSSAKAKGRRACAEAKEKILAAFPQYLHEDDIQVTPSGVTGEDLYFSPAARAVLPLTIEAKNQESLNIWAALKQAESHAEGKLWKPALIFKRNRSKLYIALSLDDFLELLTGKIHDRIAQARKPRNFDPSAADAA